MGAFIKENWVWIFGPFVIVLVAAGIFFAMDDTGDFGGAIYDLF